MGESCCGPPEKTTLLQSEAVDSVNNPATERTTAREDCGGGNASGCCGSDESPNCCGQKVIDTAALDSRCHGTPVDAPEPDCCRGKPSPCCNDSCLERLALRECHASSTAGCAAVVDKCDEAVCGKAKSCSSTATASCCQPEQEKRTPCSSHRRYARERYGTMLEALGCICRALLALGEESCCETRKPSSVTRCSNTAPAPSVPRSSVDSCCASGRAERLLPSGSRARVRKAAGVSDVSTSAPAVCARPSCCQFSQAVSGNDCCATEGPSGDSKGLKPPKPTDSTKTSGVVLLSSDPENQTAGVEHVVLCISGMTCTGCETKLNRTLAAVDGVKDLKTSLVLSRAEFNVHLQLVSVDDVVKHLERTTEFKCERIADSGSSIDVIVPGGDSSGFIDRGWPEGVTHMTVVKNSVVRITFDPAIVGARDLVTDRLGQGLRLAPAQIDQSLEAGSTHVRHVGLMTILSSILTIPVLVMAWAPLPPREIAYSSASLALASIVQVIVAGPFYPKALKALVYSRVIEMDLLIVLSTSAAYVFSIVSFGYLIAGKPLSTGQFFEASTLLVTLIMVGRYVAALARQKAVESISIRSLQTQTAILVDNVDAAGEREIDARLLQYGDFFKVLPDARIPTDGTVVTGSSEVDESLLTGESRLVDKHAKSNVIAGTINGSGTLVIRVSRLPGDNTISTIAAMVDEAKLSKPHMQRLADRVASLFVPVVVILTAVTFAVWVAVGITIQGKTGPEAAVQSITYAIAVLIVSCPCAIGLAVPMVVVIASGVAAEKGIIFKAAEAMEIAHRASHIVFDKTGTLTQGRLSVATEHLLVDEHLSLPLLLGLVSNSRHPVSEAMVRHLKGRGVVASYISEVKSLPGRGIEGQVGGQRLRAGNSRWVNATSHAMVQTTLAQGHTVLCLSIDGELAAVFGLEDSLRADATDAIAALQLRGITLHLVSGDEDGAVREVATKLGIPHDKARSRSSPGDKQAYVQRLLQDGTEPIVIFCGDGTNDAVALAQASIGVHTNHGSDVAQCAADVVLVGPDLAKILAMMDISRRAVRRIIFNFAWSFVYNMLAVLLASGALVHARIAPQYAGLGELVSVLPVVGAAVLLRWHSS
ncbi:hypothetical protein XA68_14404 [Ophiocordyceps unilateralis]|uniref:HMA domain-containing protein n=1 Tax=Ophiocordyceps unilateralis TaxID=268505 RepID=A0A2A9PMZ3_OPHUN|nr:hypothetical protein XA68_14404 [Ophiocordyceps unilateralis]